MVLIDTKTQAVTVMRAFTSTIDQSSWVDADDHWVVWDQTHDPSLQATNPADWSIWAYNRETGQVHEVATAEPAAIAANVQSPYVEPRVANDMIWWSAAVPIGSAQESAVAGVCACVFVEPESGGAPRRVATGALDPQPIPGVGAGPDGTTVYVQPVVNSRVTGGLATLTADGGVLPLVGVGGGISYFAAGLVGLVWINDNSTVVNYSPLGAIRPRVLFNANGQANAYQQFPTVGRRYVAWEQQGSGGLAYDTVTASLLQLGSLPDFESWGATYGDSLLWADPPPASLSGRPRKYYYAFVP